MSLIDYYYIMLLTTIITPIIILLIVMKYNGIKHKPIPFEHLIEKPYNYYFGKEDIDNIPIDNSLFVCMRKFCYENNINHKNGAIISLSGGVDSMVVLACLIKLSKTEGFPIYAASIDYSQRDDQYEEVEFLKTYCQKNGVMIYVAKVEGYSRKKENSGARTEFEEESRKIRFDLYKQIMKENGCNGVFVGHHKDDIIENIFTNSMKGGNLLDIEVMKKISTIHGVNIYRPFLDFHKTVIFDLAHANDIPYFLDTTPKWSRRGRMRFEIFPLLNNVFGESWCLKLKELGEQSNQWGNYIQEYVINPWVSEVKIGKYGFIMPFKDQPKLIYTNVLLKVMHSMGKHMLKGTSISKIIDNKTNFDKQITLDSGFICYIDSKKPNQFVVLNVNEIQKNIEKTKLTICPMYGNTYEDFINGNISFKQPDGVMNVYEVNVRNYNQMKILLPRELIKLFKFSKLDTYNIDLWINC